MSKKKMQKELFEAARLQDYEQAVLKRRAESSGVAEGTAGPAQQLVASAGRGILPFVIQPEPGGADVTGRAGLPLVVEAFRAYRGDELVKSCVKIKKRDRGYNEVEDVEAVLLLQASGGEHLEDLQVLRDDEGLCRLLGRQLPSPDVARGFLVSFHDEDLIKAAKKRAEEAGERSYIPDESERLKGLGEVVTKYCRRVADPRQGTSATLDHDATIIDSSKQTATWHYKGGKGYQPVAVYWAEQNLVVVDEFRDGNVPAAKDNLRLIQRAFLALPEWVTEMSFRADTACYEEKILKWLANPDRPGGPKGHIGFTISADMTVQLRAECKKVLEAGAEGDPELPRWQMLDDSRADEIVERAEVEFTPGDWPKMAVPLRYFAIRIRHRQRTLFSDGQEFKYLAVVSNREGPADEIIRWHWQKAGSIEHVHDEMKNGLGAGVLPCQEFGANAAWYRLAALTYNVLVAIKRHTLPEEQQVIKAKRLRFLVFDLAAKITTHARYLAAHIKDSALRRVAILLARVTFRQLRRCPTGLPAG